MNTTPMIDSPGCLEAADPGLSPYPFPPQPLPVRSSFAVRLEEWIRDLDTTGTLDLRPRDAAERISRDATGTVHRRVTRALHFIAEHYMDPTLSVDVVADATGISRRQLERSVRHETGRTINEHIVRTRMNAAARLLRSHPRARSGDIAALVGLAEPGTFFRTFRRFYGVSPKVYREKTVRTASAGRPASTCTLEPVPAHSRIRAAAGRQPVLPAVVRSACGILA